MADNSGRKGATSKPKTARRKASSRVTPAKASDTQIEVATEPKWAWFDSWTGRIGGVAVILFGLAALLPIYWSYLCRSSGTYCELSVASPAGGDEAREAVAERIKKGQFNSLKVREESYWFSPRRLDVIATFTDGSERAIDTLPVTAESYEVSRAGTGDFTAVTVTRDRGKLVQLIAYFPARGMERRVYDVTGSGGTLSIRNVTFDAQKNRILFDVRANTLWLRVNNSSNLKFKIPAGYGETEGGASIVLQLTDNLLAKEPLNNPPIMAC